MRLLERNDQDGFMLTEDLAGDEIPPYAILSHTWEDDQEVTFNDMKNGTGQSKKGYAKIQFCGGQAVHDGLHYFWVDTCCINKADHAELQDSINSMFRWYQNATKCYVFLSDVSTMEDELSDDASRSAWMSAFRASRWFTRGWTLQELLAPTCVEFFSREQKKLGDKHLLRKQIHKITGIPILALQGIPLSHFSANERLSWKNNRQTKIEEDLAYSLLGIFGVYIAPLYGEGIGGAFKRFLDEIAKQENCIQDLRLTDPRDDKKRIEATKGGLLEDSYRWVLENADFQRWHGDQQSQLLWVKGDPGKGKTMLLCGIIDELTKSALTSYTPAYFFCQATDSRINNATAVLRGLLYRIVDQQPSLLSHVRRRYDQAGKALFKDANAWVALSEIFANILQDPSLSTRYLIVDALDECVSDLPRLLDLVVQHSSASSRVKWAVSSRNWPVIEERLNMGYGRSLSLELNAQSVSAAVDVFIQNKVLQLAQKKKYNDKMQHAVQHHLSVNAHGTFLWVALVCQSLENIPVWRVIASLHAFPSGLDSLYRRMMDQILSSGDADLCRQILASITTVYRPITMKEMTSLVEIPEEMANNMELLQEIVGLCGSFLTLREGTIYLVHQSAKDFLLTQVCCEILPFGIERIHHSLFSRSLQVLSRTLRRDMYSLGIVGYPVEEIKQPVPDPLAMSRYSCIYWIDHLYDSIPKSFTKQIVDLQDGDLVNTFLKKKYLYWLEALSLCKSIPKGIVSLAKLEVLSQSELGMHDLFQLIQDARRFIMYYKTAIENAPLQVYVSALVFSPKCSLIRKLFEEEAPEWLTIHPDTQDEWSACLQTLEGHSRTVSSVAFSYNSTWLVSGSRDSKIKVWNAHTGECLHTLEGHSDSVRSVACSHDSACLASASDDGTVKVWDASSGICLQTLEGHGDSVTSVAFSYNSAELASGSSDKTIKIWDTSSGVCLQTLEDNHIVNSVSFSHDSTRLASSSWNNKVKIWDTSSGACLRTLEGHRSSVNSVAFSRGSTQLASASQDGTIKVWDAHSGACLQTLEDDSWIYSVTFSHDSAWLASASSDKTVKIWDASSGACLQIREGHSSAVSLVAFSHDSTRLASSSWDRTVKIWDTRSGTASPQMLEDYYDSVVLVALSHDSIRIASASADGPLRIWDTSNDTCVQTLGDHSLRISSMAFSYDSTRLASSSWNCDVKVWDVSTGACLQVLKSSRPVDFVTFSHDSSRLASWDGQVKIWDASNGECLQTLGVILEPVASIASPIGSGRLASIFDASIDSCLLTLKTGGSLHNFTLVISDVNPQLGVPTLNIYALSDLLTVPNISLTPIPKYPGLGMSSDRSWITYNSKNLVWLPSEYRGCSSVSGKTICIGLGSGEVWTCKVELDAGLVSRMLR